VSMDMQDPRQQYLLMALEWMIDLIYPKKTNQKR